MNMFFPKFGTEEKRKNNGEKVEKKRYNFGLFSFFIYFSLLGTGIFKSLLFFMAVHNMSLIAME